MKDSEGILRTLYHNFNERQADAVLAHMHDDVNWPNGWEGGYVSGHEAVKAYWQRQWSEIDPVVEPLSFETLADGRIAILVHQLIRDLRGQVLSDDQISHIYTFENGKIRTMFIDRHGL